MRHILPSALLITMALLSKPLFAENSTTLSFSTKIIHKYELYQSNVDMLNIRDDSTTNSEVIGQFNKGDKVKVMFVEGNTGFSRITFEGKPNFVATKYLSKI
ncbi:SH3 domain-containing protein [Photobacterium makurazakiensis]|uniref:SH3 domain-containing protein n=1 Tax=Photobacterium makurazakiensis TaxID=2910234 RepID=UPI003D0C77AC